MKMSNGFQFKQFFVAHNRCAMKVNTDGILLGTLAPIQSATHILDLGTGTGLIALMLAQRNQNAKITAIEIEPNAYFQALENITNSAWANRITIQLGDVMQANFPTKMDLIVSNPPYFKASLPNKSTQRDLARIATQDHLSWLSQAKNWLADNGLISFILPYDAANDLIKQSPNIGLHCVEQWQIFTKEGQMPKRSVITFSPHITKTTIHQLTIYQKDNQYSEAYRHLTRDFYLNF